MPTPRNKFDKQHLLSINRILRQINLIYIQAAKEAAAIGASIDAFNADKMFSFNDYPQTKQRADALLNRLYRNVEHCIVNGVRSEWTLANNKNNELCNRVFGDNVGRLSEAQYRRYYTTNEAARDAFLQRKEAGLGLSDRVWNYTEGYKDEIEMGIDLGLRAGQPAQEMAKDLQMYLNHPDMLFRRVRDEYGILQLSKRAADFHPGRGVYRSSYMNAKRLAATETNIAFRTADYLRWQQLDFVVGIEVHLSNNHTCRGKDGKPQPFYDICDTLAGRYPKDFKFTGWHPFCRCYATTILKTDKEIDADTQKILAGEPLDGESENKITDVPDEFKQWLADNEKRIKGAKSLPHFLKDNGTRDENGVFTLKKLGQSSSSQPIDDLLQTKKVRTVDEANKIRYNWNKRKVNNLYDAVKQGYLPESVKNTLNDIEDDLELDMFEEASRRISVLQQAARRHAARKPADIRRIQDLADMHTYGQPYVDNIHAIEVELGMKRGKRMPHEVADTGSVNPNYGSARKYRINCSTCSGAYILRRMGFDVEAKANIAANTLNRALSIGKTCWEKWIDGRTTYTATTDWMIKNRVICMDKAQYKRYIDDCTKEPGIYEWVVGWHDGGGGHSTLIERTKDGKLRLIDQQNAVDAATAAKKFEYWLDAADKFPTDTRGILRVDNAMFNPKYARAVRKKSKGRK